MAAIAIVVAIALGHFTFGERTYEGKTLSEWAAQVPPYYVSYEPEQDPEVRTAICALCTNDLAILVSTLEYDHRSSRTKLLAKLRWLPRPISNRLAYTIENPKQLRVSTALLAFRALGSNAAPAIPALARLMCGTNRTAAANAVRALSGLATNSLPALLQAAANPNCLGRYAAIEALGYVGYVGPDAEVALPVLVSITRDTNSSIAAYGVRAIGELMMEPELSLPAIRKALQHPDKEVRAAATNALAKFEADAATNSADYQ